MLRQRLEIAAAALLVQPVFPPDFARLVFMPEQIIELHQAKGHLRPLQAAMGEKFVQTGEQILKLMADPLPAPLLPVIAELLEEIERRVELAAHQIFQCVVHPMRVPVFLQHILEPFQAHDVRKRQHIVAQNLIWSMVHIHVIVFGRVIPQPGSAQHFQEAELQLLGTQSKHVVKRLAERRVILLRQPGDQIEVLIDFAAVLDFGHRAGQLREVLPPLDELVGRIVRRLHADFEAEDPRRRVFRQKIQHLGPHDVRRDFELKHAALMVVDQKLEHFHRIAAVDVKRAVQKLDRFRSVLDQVQDVGFHPFDIVIAHAHLDAGQAKLAAERAAPARLKINDPLTEVRDVFGKTVRRRQRVQIGFRTRRVDHDFLPFAVSRAEHEVELPVAGQLLQQLMERLLAVAHHDEIDIADALHPMLRIVRHLRAAQHNRRFRQHLFQQADHFDRLFDVPDVTREADHIGPALKQVGNDVHHGILDRIFGQIDIELVPAVSFKQPNGQ